MITGPLDIFGSSCLQIYISGQRHRLKEIVGLPPERWIERVMYLCFFYIGQSEYKDAVTNELLAPRKKYWRAWIWKREGKRTKWILFARQSRSRSRGIYGYGEGGLGTRTSVY
jgi:hypothetical protein